MNAGTIISTVAGDEWLSTRTAEHRYSHPTVRALPRPTAHPAREAWRVSVPSRDTDGSHLQSPPRAPMV